VQVSCVLTVYLAKQARAKVAPYPRQASVAAHLTVYLPEVYGTLARNFTIYFCGPITNIGLIFISYSLLKHTKKNMWIYSCECPFKVLRMSRSLIGVRSTASSCAIDVECVGTWPISVTSRRRLLLLHQLLLLRVVPNGSSVIGQPSAVAGLHPLPGESSKKFQWLANY